MPALGNLFMFALLAKKTPISALGFAGNLPFRRSAIRFLQNLPIRNTKRTHRLAKITTPLLVSYLRDACGLSPKSSETVAQQFLLKNTQRADAVLRLLAEYGVSRDSITALVTRFPNVLNANPDRTLRPKLDFLRSSGFAAAVIGDVVATNPRILHTSLERKLAPSVGFLKSLVPSDVPAVAFVAEVLKLSTLLVTEEHLPNFHLLESHGVPRPALLKLLLTRPRALVVVPNKLEKILTVAKRVGLPTNSAMFLHLVGILSYMSDATLVRKVKVLKDMGWSEEEAMMSLRVQPMWLCVSDRELRDRAKFFRDILLWDSSFVASNPTLLLFSIEKRCVPRCSVLNLLMQRGFLQRTCLGARRFLMPEKTFKERYIGAFQERVPEVVEAYEAECFEGWERGCWDEDCYLISLKKPCKAAVLDRSLFAP